MLGQWQFEAAMIRSVQSAVPASPLPAPGGCGPASRHLCGALRFALRAAPLAVLLTSGGPLGRAQAQQTSTRQQTAGQPTGPSVSEGLPTDPASAVSGAAFEVPASGLNSATPTFGPVSDQNQTTAADAVAGSRGRFRQASGSERNSFPPNSGLGNLNGDTARNGAGSTRAGLGVWSANAAPLLALDNGPLINSAGGGFSPIGIAPRGLPSLNQLLRGNLAMPLSSSSRAFRFSYQDALRPGRSPSELGRGSGSILFSSSDLGNGIFFSAGTGYGIRTTPEAPSSSSFGLTNTPGAKHSGPAVNLKLSF